MSTTTIYPRLSSERMPPHQEYETARQTFRAIRRYFSRPGIQAEFAAWKQARAAEREANDK